MSQPQDDFISIKYPDEPARFIPKDLEGFLVWCVKNEGSDITIQTNSPIVVEIHGKLHKVTNRRLTSHEVMDLVVSMYNSESAKSKLSGNEALDFAYEVKPDRFTRFRFRMNVTSINVEGNTGLQITARSISSLPPKLSDLGVEEDIIQNMTPKEGLVVITGGTGSGKSTLLSAIIRSLAEDPHGHRKILTYESPIEFVYDEVEMPTTSVAQTEIPKHLPSFAEGTRNALRRHPSIILIGEARDAETIGETITASMTGHLVFTTVHSNGFAETIRRMVNVFTEDKNSRAIDIISSLRVVVSQKLVPSTDGRRVALREYVIFNDEIVDYLLDQDIEDLTASSRYVLKQYGRSFLQDAAEKYKAGRISEKVYREVARMAKAEVLDAISKSPQNESLNDLLKSLVDPEVDLGLTFID